jgi:hypothetical protein
MLSPSSRTLSTASLFSPNPPNHVVVQWPASAVLTIILLYSHERKIAAYSEVSLARGHESCSLFRKEREVGGGFGSSFMEVVGRMEVFRCIRKIPENSAMVSLSQNGLSFLLVSHRHFKTIQTVRKIAFALNRSPQPLSLHQTSYRLSSLARPANK